MMSHNAVIPPINEVRHLVGAELGPPHPGPVRGARGGKPDDPGDGLDPVRARKVMHGHRIAGTNQHPAHGHYSWVMHGHARTYTECGTRHDTARVGGSVHRCQPRKDALTA